MRSDVKNLFIIASFVVVLVFGLNYLKNKVGDPRPAVLPNSSRVNESLEPQSPGGALPYPLKIKEGYEIGIFASGLSKARDVVFSSGGTLIVSILDKGKVVALPDRDKDGIADEEVDIITGKNDPHGLAFFDQYLIVASEERVDRYIWDEESLTATFDKKILDLPKGDRHRTRSLAISDRGEMYVSIGSRCNVCFENDPWIASIIKTDIDGNDPQVFATGLRNAVFITLKPGTQELWGTEMGRDFLGNDLPPDEINKIEAGNDYGWPVCYGDKIYDTDFGQENSQYCQNTTAPIYKIGAHSAPLGLVFIDSAQFDQELQGDLLVAYHGSWNRTTPTGYKIVRLDLDGETPVAFDFIDGWLVGNESWGRPVDLAFDNDGSLFISDDKGGNIYKIVRKEDDAE